jgi:hypothetical protein
VAAQAVEVDKFIAGLAESGEFWLFAAGSFEWYYVLGEIGRVFFPDCDEDTEDFGVMIPRDGRDPVFWARRSMLPVSEVSRRLGVAETTLEKVKLIRLAPFAKGPVEPTVDYYGTA